MSSENDIIRPSQIDTSVELSQSTISAMFGSQTTSELELLDSAQPSEVALSQGAVHRAFGLPEGVLQADESEQDVLEGATQLQLLSEASGAESVGSEAPAARRLRPRHKFKQDVNFVEPNENPNDYEQLSSEESDGGALADNEEDQVERRGIDGDDDTISDTDAVQMDEAFLGSLSIGDDDQLSAEALTKRKQTLRAMRWTQPSSNFEFADAYPGLVAEDAVPVPDLRNVCHSPLETFFYFAPKSLWIQICEETNRYSNQQLVPRAERMRAKQTERRGTPTETLKQIRRRLRMKPAYETHELLHVIGLLVAHMLCPTQRRFAQHWAMTEDGAVPAGTFGRFMPRNRCQDILRDLHFVDNENEPSRDKLRKLRPVVDKLQKRFLAGWTLPTVFSFDEGVLPATSKRNTTRMFMPDKPHRYGSKMFMTCDARTAYCHRFEIYVGKLKSPGDQPAAFDHKTGAAAVVRNLKVVLASGRQNFHAVTIDRFYSSIPLAIELLSMCVYVVGTIMTGRLGYDRNVVETRKTRPRTIPRGSFTFSRSLSVPSMVAFHWWDRKPVHYLCTGSVMTASMINRNVKGTGPTTVPCPKAVNDYQEWMGGVDVHDQLRLQTFSIQTSVRFAKYYKSLFLGLMDLVMVNAYISHKEACKFTNTPAMKRGEWFNVLHKQLLQLKEQDFAGTGTTPSPGSKKRRRKRHDHSLIQFDDWVTVSGVQKRRQRSCKVCALLRGERKKSYQTTFYCDKCSIDDAKCYLCPKARREYRGTMKTCFQIWHEDFDCGLAIPASLGKCVVLRRPGKKTGVRKKTRRELLREEGCEADDEQRDGSDERSDGGSEFDL